MSLVQTRDPIEANLFLTEPKSVLRRQKIVHEFQRKPKIELVSIKELKAEIAVLEEKLRLEEMKKHDAIRTARKVMGDLRAEQVKFARAHLLYGPFSKEKLENTDKCYPTLEEIMRDVSEKYKISVLDIKSARRTADIMMPRKEYYYRAKMETLNSYPEIGKYCGGRDHTTVMSGAQSYAHINKLPMP